MKRLFTICLVLLLCASSAYGTPVGDAREKLGAFTGPVNGAAQDDNVKASLDILHALVGPSMIKGQGSTFYVDVGISGSAGTSWATAVGTLDEAIDLCTEDRGDIILIAEGHTETLAGADAANFDIAGITAYGLGSGEQRPVFDITTSGELVIGDNDTWLYNLVFKAHSPDVAHAIDVETTATGYVIENCEFIVHTEGTDEFTDSIEIAVHCDYGVIKNCRFQQGGGAADSAIYYVGADYLRIIDNEIMGDYAVGCLESGTTISVGVVIKDNILYNGDTGTIGLNAQPCMELYATDTGMIVNNACFCDVDTPEDAIVAADMHLAENYYSESESGDNTAVIIGQGDLQERWVTSLQTTIIDTNNLLFTIAGGPIKLIEIIGIVETDIEPKACVINYLHAPTIPAGGVGVAFGTSAPGVEINNDDAGTIYTWDGVVATDLTATDSGVAIGMANGTGIILTPGSLYLQAAVSTSATGAIRFYMRYSPLGLGCVVKAD